MNPLWLCQVMCWSWLDSQEMVVFSNATVLRLLSAMVVEFTACELENAKNELFCFN